MNINDAFPSNYVKCCDLQGRDVTVTINKVVMEKLGDDDKPVIYFQGTYKGLALNKTNASRIGNMLGLDTDQWLGQVITLYPTETEFRGDIVACIRVRSQQPSGTRQPASPSPFQQQPAASPTPNHPPVPESEIPF